MILIPFFILIGLNGFRKRRIHASYLFFFYTLFGSFLMLTCIFFIYSFCGSMNFEYLLNSRFAGFREGLI
jgi:NADH:ubiquinone oxidoreductase subunit 4 (subunit M)